LQDLLSSSSKETPVPNGRSGGFVIKRIDLEQLLLSVPPDTVIGMRFDRPGLG
jgi:hypothetical protein